MASTSAAATAGTSSSLAATLSPKQYDVFISFRGEDTRRTFTSHLHDALCRKNIKTYIDNRLDKGDEVWPELVKAIHDSSIFLVILSENYASSSWCLKELIEIMECQKKGHVVVPVFYNIEPSDVRKQTGSYQTALAKHMNMQSNDTVQKWKDALSKVADVSGFDSLNYRNETILVNQIVETVLKKLNDIYMPQNNKKILVGIHKELAYLESLVVTESEDVRVIGIWGMGGVGKTTIAEELFDRLHSKYEGSFFARNVRERLEKSDVTHLQDELVRALLGKNDQSIGIFSRGREYIRRRLRRKKILLVLDDVNDLRKLGNLYGGPDLFGQGSSVIVTSRDKQVLANLVDYIYEVKTLKDEDSLELFSLHAFKENYPKKEWMDLSMRAINYAKGIPLAIEVLGSSLYDKNEKEVWESQLEKLEKMPLRGIQNVLRLSYDELDREEQDLFLCLACFSGYHKLDTFLLDYCGYLTKVGLTTLRDKALISVNDALYSKVKHWNWEMHDLIREMGKEIVRGESRDPGKRRHLWDPDDVYPVLENATGTETIQSLSLKVSSESKELCLNPKAFTGMLNLKFLNLDTYDDSSHKRKAIAPKGLKSMPDGLRVLKWVGCPLKFLQPKQSSFCAENLFELDLSHSKLERLWDGVQNLVKLKEITLRGCDQLTELPDFSKALNIRHVDLTCCCRLSDLHPSILSLDNLEVLSLYGSKMLKRLRSDHQLKSLLVIYAGRCTSLEEFSVMSESIRHLDLSDTSIVDVNSLGLPLNKLLDYGISKGLRLPHNFLEDCNLWGLRRSTLDFFDPRYFRKCLTSLSLCGTNIETLPTSIK